MIGAARRLLAHPRHLWIPLVLHRCSEGARAMRLRAHDRWLSSYGRAGAPLVTHLDASVFEPDAPDWLGPVCELFVAHRFPWLGTDWYGAGYEDEAPGLAGHRYDHRVPAPDRIGAALAGRLAGPSRSDALARWAMIDEPYRPVDWQRDHRCGFRWQEGRASMSQPVTPAPGADVKQPWELGRLQHLPLIALAHGHALRGGAGLPPPRELTREFRNLVLDFVASNPPRFGIQWRCTMDVAIRAANLVVGWDLMRAGGAVFDAEFEKVLAASVADHGWHVWLHPERRPDFAANHYLADLAGLLFAAAYLPDHPMARTWREYAARDLDMELRRQFLDDGANFEASVGYHRLSGEIAVYATALRLGAADIEPDPAWAGALLDGIARFTRAVSRPDGVAAPVGDLDSGRFLRLSTRFEAIEANATPGSPGTTRWVERLECHAHLPSACAALAGLVDAGVEARVLRSLARGRAVQASQSRPMPDAGTAPSGAPGFAALMRDLDAAPHQRRYEFTLGTEAVEWTAFRTFGLFVIRGLAWHLTVRCGAVGQAGAGGHAHNDQLSITLHVGGRTVIEDPGVFVYGALPERRDAYRSVRAHFAPRPETGEPGSLALGMFRLGREGEGRCLWFGPDGFVGEHRGFGYRIVRVVTWHDGRLQVRDISFGESLVDLAPEGRWDCPVPVALRYGMASLA